MSSPPIFTQSANTAGLTQFLEQHPKQILIFDFDDTIFTLDLPWHEYFDGLVARLAKLDPSLHEFRNIAELEHAAVDQHGDEAVRLIRAWSGQFETEKLRGVSEHSQLTNFIRTNRDNYRFFLWTSNMRASVEPVLDRTGLLPMFSKLITKDSVRYTKPNPEGFAQIHAGEPLDEFLFVGDSVNDQQAAAAVGIDFFKVAH